MDPTKCLTELLQDLSDGSYVAVNRDEVVRKLRELSTFLAHGGFPPDVDEAVGEYLKSV